MRTSFLLAAALATSTALFAAGCDKSAATTDTTTTTPPVKADALPPKPDNTAANKADMNTGAKTPMDQGESAADVKITADIRRALMDDKDLSTNAKNAKVITNNAAVTLRGVVDTAAEKSSLEAKARAIAGVASVDDQLTVKTP